jgi:hypothetical protein
MRPSAREQAAAVELRMISQRSITRLDVRIPRGRLEGARTYSLFGAAVGGVTGVLLGLAASGISGESSTLGYVILASTGSGALYGAIGGAIWPGAEWRRVPLGTTPPADR